MNLQNIKNEFFKIRNILFLQFTICIILISGCNPFKKSERFELISSNQSGIKFSNTIIENDSNMNVLRFEYIYNGAGVGVGDFNNDGLTDVFFAGNQVSCRLYLNQGDFKFKDITLQAGLTTKNWCTGVSLVDINQDGNLDIFVSTINPHKNKYSKNLLFLNKGVNKNKIPVFEEMAEQAGFKDSSYSTQAAFLDYDLDGDLDMYLVTNALENYNRNVAIEQKFNGSGKSVDKFYRNNGNDKSGRPCFTNVSIEAGILWEGWGLGIVVNDFNFDGYPDVYVANDFLSNDHLYINNKNGTFTNHLKNYFKHTEHNGMGVDVADFNNDGFNDIAVVDMMPDDNLRQKTMFSSISYDRFQLNIEKKYLPQYVRNVLQVSNGNGTFSDVGYMSNTYATDWSWSPLFADLDNDGLRDLLITNGYQKDVTNLDFVSYNDELTMFGTPESKYKALITEANKLKGVKKKNYGFKNIENFQFADKSEEWGLSQISYTNGTAYADFDNDGDLDLIMNNINDEAFLYRNNTIREKNQTESNSNYLRIKLAGEKGNYEGLGAKISVYYDSKKQFSEHQTIRGYKSTIEAFDHFGLGKIKNVDSVAIEWPSGKMQTIRKVKANQILLLSEKNATKYSMPLKKISTTIFNNATSKFDLNYYPQEDDFIDFKVQHTLPHKHSQMGPGIAVADINGDGLEDFYIGGAANHPGSFFYAQSNGRFKQTPFKVDHKIAEDMGVLFFDADNDGDQDLYCVSGSTEFGKNLSSYKHRFYRNIGNGDFINDSLAIPGIYSSGSCVIANDFDKDGDLDLFVGGRISPEKYPMAPQSYVLQNNGKGTFKNITKSVVPDLEYIGMVTSALWSDFDNDGWTDLIVTGEFMPVMFYKNNHGKLSKLESDVSKNVGWWNSIIAGDFDNDGDIDYVAGNVGLNCRYKASDKEPVCVYAKDFDKNGTIDAILCNYNQGVEYPVHPRETFTGQINSLRKKFTKYSTYGNMPFKDIFDIEQLKDAYILKSNYFQSAFIQNLGNGKFKMTALPSEAQISPIFGMLAVDFDDDGNLDLLTVGNDFSNEVLTGFYDSGIGTCLKGDGKGNFKSVHNLKSGFFVDSDAKGLAEITLKNNQSLILVTSNKDTLKVFENRYESKKIKIEKNDAFAEIEYLNGKKQKVEFYYGSGYLSQSTRLLTVPKNFKNIFITDTKEKKRKI